MDLVFATPAFGTSRNVSFMPLVATELSERGHTIRGVQYKPGDVIDTVPVDIRPITNVRTPYWAGQWVRYRSWRERFAEYLDDHEPDVIVADRMAMVPSIEVGSARDIPVLGVIPGLGFTRFNPWKLDPDKSPTFRELPWSAKLQYAFVRSLFRQHQRALSRATEIVVISEFLKKTIAATFGRDATIVRTPVRLDEVVADTHNPQYLSLVNPRTELKGASIFFDFAEALEYEFLVAGEFADEANEARARGLANVTHRGWVEDMREVYAETNLVLVPSLVEEGGGPRVVIEGFANGIPAVGTDRGAIPEHIDDVGSVISDPYDVTEWDAAIRNTIDRRTRLAERARERARLFDADRQVDMFEGILEGCLQ